MYHVGTPGALTLDGGMRMCCPQDPFQTLLIFFLILALRVGESPTREGPGYATAYRLGLWQIIAISFIS